MKNLNDVISHPLNVWNFGEGSRPTPPHQYPTKHIAPTPLGCIHTRKRTPAPTSTSDKLIRVFCAYKICKIVDSLFVSRGFQRGIRTAPRVHVDCIEIHLVHSSALISTYPRVFTATSEIPRFVHAHGVVVHGSVSQRNVSAEWVQLNHSINLDSINLLEERSTCLYFACTIEGHERLLWCTRLQAFDSPVPLPLHCPLGTRVCWGGQRVRPPSASCSPIASPCTAGCCGWWRIGRWGDRRGLKCCCRASLE